MRSRVSSISRRMACGSSPIPRPPSGSRRSAPEQEAPPPGPCCGPGAPARPRPRPSTTVRMRAASQASMNSSSTRMMQAVSVPSVRSAATPAPPSIPAPTPARLPFSVISARASAISWRTSVEVSCDSCFSRSPMDSLAQAVGVPRSRHQSSRPPGGVRGDRGLVAAGVVRGGWPIGPVPVVPEAPRRQAAAPSAAAPSRTRSGRCSTRAASGTPRSRARARRARPPTGCCARSPRRRPGSGRRRTPRASCPARCVRSAACSAILAGPSLPCSRSCCATERMSRTGSGRADRPASTAGRPGRADPARARSAPSWAFSRAWPAASWHLLLGLRRSTAVGDCRLAHVSHLLKRRVAGGTSR